MKPDQVQVIVCKCGSVFAACVVPHCYQDKDWMKDVRIYSAKGCAIEVRNHDDFKFNKCVCDQVKNELTLFS